MTRLFAALAGPLVLLSLIGCGGGDDSGPEAEAGAGAGTNGAGTSGGGSGEGGSTAGRGGTGAAGGAADPLEYRPCGEAERVGGFILVAAAEVEADPPIPAKTELRGEILDGVQPANLWDELAAADGCRVVVGPQHVCDPQCASEQTCGPDGCIATPRTRSVGTVVLDGLPEPVTMMPSSVRRYSPTSVLPYPPFEPGTAIALQAEGGDYDAFALRGRGVTLLQVDDQEITVATGEPVTLRWTPGDEAAAKVFVELDIAHHGGIAARIECDVEDDGELVIPAELVTRLVERGTAGFPTVTLTRRTVDSTEIEPGCVDLEVGSQVIRAVTVPGVTSCSNTHPCPDGQTCQFDLTCG